MRRPYVRFVRWWRWRPDGPLAVNIIQALAPRRAESIRAYQNERSRIANQMAAQGTVQSGGFFAAIHKAAAAEVEAYATFATNEIVDTMTRVLGAVYIGIRGAGSWTCSENSSACWRNN